MNNKKYAKILNSMMDIFQKIDLIRMDLEVEPILNQHQDRIRLILGGWIPELALLLEKGNADFKEEVSADKANKGVNNEQRGWNNKDPYSH